jgi:twitching motility protein PilT
MLRQKLLIFLGANPEKYYVDQQTFINLLSSAVQNEVSDIHLQVGQPPAFRLKGDLVNLKTPALADKDIFAILGYILTDPKVRAKVGELRDYDGSFEVKNLARFRVNVMKNQGKMGVVMRVIPFVVPTIEKLGLPPVLKTIAEMPRGLVLVTGVTGSGKSSTLAAMIDHLNSTQPLHILTIEDPIEFIHPMKRARLTQREVGSDTENFSHALRAALRQDPDVILVGEMRDAETIDIAIKAAETGHLVFSTAHTNDAIKTIGRLISVFPPSEQKMVRMRLSENLVSTISQRLIPRASGKGMVAGQEIMISNGGIAECIANPEMTGQMNDFIQKSYQADGSGGRTFEQHLVQLYLDKVITMESAMAFSTNPSDFQRNLMYGSKGTGDTPKMDDDLQLDRPETKAS